DFFYFSAGGEADPFPIRRKKRKDRVCGSRQWNECILVQRSNENLTAVGRIERRREKAAVRRDRKSISVVLKIHRYGNVDRETAQLRWRGPRPQDPHDACEHEEQNNDRQNRRNGKPLWLHTDGGSFVAQRFLNPLQRHLAVMRVVNALLRILFQTGRDQPMERWRFDWRRLVCGDRLDERADGVAGERPATRRHSIENIPEREDVTA